MKPANGINAPDLRAGDRVLIKATVIKAVSGLVEVAVLDAEGGVKLARIDPARAVLTERPRP